MKRSQNNGMNFFTDHQNVVQLTTENIMKESIDVFDVHVKDENKTFKTLLLDIEKQNGKIYVHENRSMWFTSDVHEFITYIETYVAKRIDTPFTLYFSKSRINSFQPFIVRFSDLQSVIQLSVKFCSNSLFMYEIPLQPNIYSPDIIRIGNNTWITKDGYKACQWPDNASLVVSQVVYNWCKNEAEGWLFPDCVEFSYKWQRNNPVSFVATCEYEQFGTYYTITIDGVSVETWDEGRFQSRVQCEIDDGVWKDTEYKQPYRKLMLQSLSDVSKTFSLNHACNADTIHQLLKDCWYISGVVLASKTLYRHLNTETKDFLQIYRRNVQPESSKGACILIPPRIAQIYRDIRLAKNDNINFLESVFVEGGNERDLLCAFMQFSNIKHIVRDIRIYEHFDDLSQFDRYFKDANVEYIVARYIFKWKQLLINTDSIIKKVINVHDINRKGSHVIGGLIFSSKERSDHAIPFTVCAGETIICNYGKCFELLTDSTSLADDRIHEISFLIKQNDRVSKVRNENKTRRDNLDTLKLVSTPHGIVILLSQLQVYNETVTGVVHEIVYSHDITNKPVFGITKGSLLTLQETDEKQPRYELLHMNGGIPPSKIKFNGNKDIEFITKRKNRMKMK